MTTEMGAGRVNTTGTVFRIVETLRELDGARVTELAEHLDVAASTAHRHLSTLHDLEYVVKDGDVYRLSFKFLRLGEHTRDRRDAYRMAKEKVSDLADETEERAQFIIEEHGQAVYVFRENGVHAVPADSGIGKRIPLHATAAGKAILAHLPDERVDEILDKRGLAAQTTHTTVDETALREELEMVQDRGYSFNKQESIEGLRAVGVVVTSENDRVLGALSVSGPTHRLKDDFFEEEVPSLLLGTANELELNIKYN